MACSAPKRQASRCRNRTDSSPLNVEELPQGILAKRLPYGRSASNALVRWSVLARCPPSRDGIHDSDTREDGCLSTWRLLEIWPCPLIKIGFVHAKFVSVLKAFDLHVPKLFLRVRSRDLK